MLPLRAQLASSSSPVTTYSVYTPAERVVSGGENCASTDSNLVLGAAAPDGGRTERRVGVLDRQVCGRHRAWPMVLGQAHGQAARITPNSQRPGEPNEWVLCEKGGAAADQGAGGEGGGGGGGSERKTHIDATRECVMERRPAGRPRSALAPASILTSSLQTQLSHCPVSQHSTSTREPNESNE